jgi:NOL1/NOP2/fmu family ribosome biogenesis protein
MRPPETKIIKNEERERIIHKLKDQFNVETISEKLVRKGAERIFVYSGSLNEKEILEIEKVIPVERVGIYFAKEVDDEIRLSIEGTHLLKEQINKNIFELNEEQMLQWMHGSELNLKPETKGFVAMKYEKDFLGTGKASEEKISNFIPKSRRLKFKEK